MRWQHEATLPHTRNTNLLHPILLHNTHVNLKPHACLLTPARTFLSSSSTKLSTFEASTALYDAERSIRAEAQRKAAIASQQAAFEADRKPLIEEKKAQAARTYPALPPLPLSLLGLPSL